MTFTLRPIIDTMLELYAQPRNPKRFADYLSMLRDGPKGDMVLPIAGFNPMAKDHATEKLQELKALQAEELIQNTLAEINWTHAKELKKHKGEIQVVLNLADDWKGAWTNRYTTDYDSKFKLNAFVTRQFCVPHIWTSETYSEEQIIRRARDYVFRTIHWLKKPKPSTLSDHIEQEIWVARQSLTSPKHYDKHAFQLRHDFLRAHGNSDDYGLIFNFLYGDAASDSLGFQSYGLTSEPNGYMYAKIQALMSTDAEQ